MEMNGFIFLNKIYKDLADSDEVLKSLKEAGLSRSISREDKIKVYMESLKVDKDNLIESICGKYVVKGENISLNSLNGQSKKAVIEAQKESLKRWINYLTDETVKYPIWTKYWAFQGMLKIGDYDEANDIYLRRTKKTIAPFIDINPEIVANCIDIIMKYVNKENISDKEVLDLVNSGSFSKLYTTYFRRYKRNMFVGSLNNDGIWIKYRRNNREDAIKLANSLQGYGTRWCTASEVTAINQLCGGDSYVPGDFYVYYTKDENFEYKVPRIAIRLEDFRIVEVRGVSESQNLEDGLEDILKEKLQTLDNRNVDRFLKMVDNAKKLSKINYKNRQKIPLTEEEILFLYEATEKIDTFGLDDDPRIKKIKNSRNLQDDYDSLRNREFKILFLINKKIDDLVVSDKEVAMEAVSRNGLALRHIVRDIDNYEDIVLNAVKQNGAALQYVDRNIINYNEVIMEAAKQSVHAFNWIDKNIDNFQEIAIESAKANGYGLKYVNPKVDDYGVIAMEAVKKNWGAFQYVDKGVNNYKDILIEGVRNGQRNLEILDSTIPNYKELAIAAIYANFQAIRWLRCPYIVYNEIVFEVVLKNNFALQYVLTSFKNYTKLALEVVKSNGLAIEYVYKYADDYKEIAIVAIRQNPFAIEYVSKDSRYYNEILEEVLNIDSDILIKIQKKKIKTR